MAVNKISNGYQVIISFNGKLEITEIFNHNLSKNMNENPNILSKIW